MKISQLVYELNRIKEQEGDIEVTVTASYLEDGFCTRGSALPDVFESTCETLIVTDKDNGNLDEKRVRLYL